MPKPLVQTTGRRKQAIARVRIRPGRGTIVVNGRPIEDYFPSETHRMVLSEPLTATSTNEVYDVDATIFGGGVSGQAGALRLGIARALVYNPYAINFGTVEGNQFLLEEIAGDPALIPQFVCSFATDDLAEIDAQVTAAGVRALRAFPVSHRYPLVPWIADRWLGWMAERRLSRSPPSGA